MRRYSLAVLLTVGLLSLLSTQAQALMGPTASMSLGGPTVMGQMALFDVTVVFTPEFDEKMSGLFLDVSGSDNSLTETGTDFSRFSFEVNPTLTDWEVALQFDSVVSQGIVGTAETAAQLGGGSHLIGTLKVDLTGLAPGSVHTVRLVPGSDFLSDPSGSYVEYAFEFDSDDDEPAVGFGYLPVGAEGVLTVPTDGNVDVIPEPTTAALGVLALGGLGLSALRRRRA